LLTRLVNEGSASPCRDERGQKKMPPASHDAEGSSILFLAILIIRHNGDGPFILKGECLLANRSIPFE
jgi:hypothetical protein